MSEDASINGPEFEVWNHLESGLALAEQELDVLDDPSRLLVDKVAELVARLWGDFVIRPEDRELAAGLKKFLANPWARHAAEVQLARRSIDRASESLQRFADLQPVVSQYQLTSKTRRYLKEAVDAFLLGFDPACIAFCGATLEQLFKELLVTRKVIQPPTADDEWSPGGSQLLDLVVKGDLIHRTSEAAKRLLRQRNRVMHRSIWDEKVLKGVALACLQDLAAVLEELTEA